MKLAAFPKCYMDDLCVHRTMDMFQWVDLARRELKQTGVTGLETYYGALASFEPAYLAELKAAHTEAGFVAPMFCASPDFTSPDPAHRTSEIERHRTMIRVAAALGSETCRVLSGQRRPEVSVDDGIKWVVESITSLLPYAEKHGVILVMENHFKDNYWQYPEFAQKMDRYCAILDRIDNPWFGVNYDPSNTLLAGEDPIELLERVKHRVITVHASDRRLRRGVTPGPEGITDYSQLIHGEVGTGAIDYDSIFRILKSVDFRGWISIEDGVNGIEELQRSALFLSKHMGIKTQLAR